MSDQIRGILPAPEKKKTLAERVGAATTIVIFLSISAIAILSVIWVAKQVFA